MSASSVRRIKERGGGGGTVMPVAVAAKSSKTLTPVSEKSINGGEPFKRSTGKENPRPTSRVRAASATATTQKPVIRPMPRIDKTSAIATDRVGSRAEPRARWSTSSVPRGRSSSPSDFTRDLSDSRKNPRISLDRAEVGSMSNGVLVSNKVSKKGNLKGSSDKTGEKSEIGIRDLRESRESTNSLGLDKSNELVKESELKSEQNENTKAWMLRNCENDVNSSSISMQPSSASGSNGSDLTSNVKSLNGARMLEDLKVKSGFVSRSNGAVVKSEINSDLGLKDSTNGKSKVGLRHTEAAKEKDVTEVSVAARSTNKYPSKLHEKLAYLEGKVKRIASDIKRTKEMLDLNNPDASKVILSDIQEKISGIEKAMCHVADDADGKGEITKSKENCNGPSNVFEKFQDKQANHAKSSVKGLNTDELEARLFPHHKLLRERTSKSISESSETKEPKFVESSSELKVEGKSLSPIDENPIALEFLASLNKEQSKVCTRGRNVEVRFCEVQEMDGAVTSMAQDSSLNSSCGKGNIELILTTNEKLEEFDDQENIPAMVIEEETEDSCIYQLNGIGCKTSTGGWFVSEGESVLLAHDDGSCSFYDIANCEEKAEYKPPLGVSPNVWRDCWIIRAPGADGCSGRYVVAASAGNTMDSGFCSWDFYSKDVRAFHIENGNTATRAALAPLPNNALYRRNALSTVMAPENLQWWYKPCGPLIISTASCQKVVKIYDIRDGEQIMKWEVMKPVLAMDYSSPLQWRNRGKVVVAEAENISLWDVSSFSAQALLTVSSSGRKISALHVNNTDAELGGGVRQRVSSSEAEGNDGVFCTPDSINVLDFRHPSGVGLKIPKISVNVQSVYSRGDSIFLGCTNVRSSEKKQSSCQVQQFSLRKQRLVTTYVLPESNAHFHYTALTQVWGNSNLVMGVCGLGLFVFDALKDDGLQSFNIDYGITQNVKEIIGPDDLYSPSFDYLGSRVLLISRDRPALWRFLS